MDTHLEAIQQVHQAFGAIELQYWLFGGWAVDFHVGRVTRSHADIDIVVWLRDIDRVRDVLENDGWRAVTYQPEDGYVTFERDGVGLDLAFVTQDDTGIIYTPSNRGRGNWPAGSFGPDVASMGDIEAHVIARAALIADKSEPHGGPEAAAKDRADLAVLTSPDDATA
jgi:hypothetical protein